MITSYLESHEVPLLDDMVSQGPVVSNARDPLASQ